MVTTNSSMFGTRIRFVLAISSFAVAKNISFFWEGFSDYRDLSLNTKIRILI